MKIKAQELEWSSYNHQMHIVNKNIEIDESNILCLMITQKDHATKNHFEHQNVEISYINNKTIIPYKEFKVFMNDGSYKKFNVYENNLLDNLMKDFKFIIKSSKPLIFDNFLGDGVLSFNNDNYCYVDKSKILNSVIRNGHKDLGNAIYEESKIDELICKQEIEGCINFKILELDLGIRKVKLNMYQKKTLEHNEMYAPGLLTVKQMIKRML